MNQPSHSSNAPLEKLSDTGLELADSRQDIRGRKAVDSQGADIGHVSALFIDADEQKVRMVEIRAGGFLGLGERHFLLPVDAIAKVIKDEIQVGETRERIVSSPVFDPKLVEAPTHDYVEPFYGYYGFAPYWGPGYLYPGLPITGDPSELQDQPVRTRSS